MHHAVTVGTAIRKNGAGSLSFSYDLRLGPVVLPCAYFSGPRSVADGDVCNTTHPGRQYSLIPTTFPMEKAVSTTNDDHRDRSTTDETHTHSRGTLAEGHSILSPNSAQARDDNALTIDWDGPDDPENPRK